VSKPTPGEWVVSKIKPTQVPAIGIDARGHWISFAAVYCTGRKRKEEAMANARIMAASKELLAACEAYIAGIDSGNEPPGHIRKIHADMRAAVAKATGGTP
jgi:hypothetical protein